jgi:hypothetical protein
MLNEKAREWSPPAGGGAATGAVTGDASSLAIFWNLTKELDGNPMVGVCRGLSGGRDGKLPPSLPALVPARRLEIRRVSRRGVCSFHGGGWACAQRGRRGHMRRSTVLP